MSATAMTLDAPFRIEIFAEDVVVPGGQSEEELKRALAKALAKAV